MVNECFVLHEEVIDVFHNKFYIATIEKCHFILLLLGFLVQCNVERLDNIFTIMYQNNIKSNKDDTGKFSKTTGIKI